MRKVREALRLKFSCGLNISGIARSLNVARSTVSEYLSRADSAGISWLLPDDIDKARHPEGYQYTRFCNLYREWEGHLDLPMRFHHKAGEKLFVDYAKTDLIILDDLGLTPLTPE